jgi:hypothetical protein
VRGIWSTIQPSGEPQARWWLAGGSLVAQVERRLFFSFADVNHNPFPAQLLGDVLMLRAAAISWVLGPRVARSGKFPNHGTTTAK